MGLGRRFLPTLHDLSFIKRLSRVGDKKFRKFSFPKT